MKFNISPRVIPNASHLAGTVHRWRHQGGQNTAYCLENPGECEGPDGQIYYCSHGITDNPSNQPQGFCCPAGEYAFFNIVENSWECTEPDECGITGVNLAHHCFFDFESDEPSWLMSIYDESNTDNWCVSMLPELYNPLDPAQKRSSACCLIDQFGQTDYYVADRNVKIFGN